ncbi:MAG: phosphoglycerate dehydrogenase [Campylobacterales bacterium]
MKKYKIVVCDHIHTKGLDILDKESDISLLNLANLKKDELLEVISEADVAITRSSTDVDVKFLEHAKNLKAIVRAGVGVDNVDIPECSRRGVVVMNVPTANTIAAVELTMAHLLNAARMFPYAHNQLKYDKVWKREDWYGIELSGKTLGIIGFGNIGSRVGIRAKAFDMDVKAYDPYIKPSKATDLGVEYTTSFDEILQCDFITIHTPKNKETIDMIDKDEIGRIKEGATLLNVARGGLYNEQALYEALKSKKIRFAGIDVFTKEPATENRLLDLDNINVTPHLGANTLESQEKIATQAAECALLAAKGIAFKNALNLPVKESELPPFAKPYFELVQKIGFFLSQTNKGAITSIKISAEGEIGEFLDSLATFGAVGALRSSIGENVNYVNAQFIAKERGIEIETEKLANSSGYKNLVTVRLTTDRETLSISGTVFGEDWQRIVEINGFTMDIEPKGKMLLFHNTDVPGVIGDVGSILAKHKINIADFRLGRGKHNQALAAIIVDDEAGKDVLRELSSLKACLGISYVEI